MVATIDKASITALKTDDPLVFKIGFDFTDDTIVDPTKAYLYVWKHAEFVYNTNMTGAEFNTAASAAMMRARKPTTESVLETQLKNLYGATVNRVDLSAPTPNDGKSADYPMYVRVVT